MAQDELFQQFPIRRIKPFDGMAVTAEVWEEAHEFHQQRERFHALFGHGAGILAGLQVLASDPPDSAVYILSGLAVDPAGQMIVLAQPLSYDLGVGQGTLHLVLSYGEAQTQPTEQSGTPGILHIQSQFILEATQTLPSTPCVELARVRRPSRSTPITNAEDPLHPGPGEIDLRFRQNIGASPPKTVGLAVCYAGGTTGDAARRHGNGAKYLARSIKPARDVDVWLDDNVRLAPTSNLPGYTLVYLVGQGNWKLSPDEMKALYAYLQGGGTVLMESCRHDPAAGSADAAFLDLLASFGAKLGELSAGHPLLTEPFLFAAPPPGFETEHMPGPKVSEGVIWSTYDYGCLWQGERRGGPASREDIRAAMEWGSNLVAYALERRRNASKRK